MIRARAALVCSVLVACIGCDHAVKAVATALLPPQGLSLAADLVQLQLVRNPGAFLGLGAGLPDALRIAILGGLVPLGLVAGVVWLLRGSAATRLQLAAAAAIAGGGLANWIDRLAHGGAVTDFVSVGVGPVRTGIFNLADVAVVGGMLALLLATRAAERRA